MKTTDELTKNHRAHDVQAEEGGMMIANDGPFCPVSSFEKYFSVLNPMNEYLFQRPKKSAGEGEIWYDNMVVGENTLGKKMKVISHQEELSTIIKATTITILDRSGFEAQHIVSVSGHRNESSIKTYSKTDTNTKTNMAGSLMAVIDNNKNNVVASEAGENDRNEELGLLTNSQEEFILRDLHVQTHNHCNQSTKQFNFYNCTVTFL